MKNKTLAFFIGIILALIIGTVKVEAATATISASKTTAEVGDEVTITVNFTAAAWNLNVSGDGITGKSYASQTSDLSEQSSKETFKLDTSKAGTYTIKLTGDITDKDGNTTDINTSTTIKVNEKTVVNNDTSTNQGTSTNNNTNTNANNNTQTPQKSTNAKLSNLGINPKEYDFNDFKSNKENYTATVPYEIEEVEVWYKKSDSKSTVKVTGGNSLEVGDNKITVKVTAEDGKTTKTYTINVQRQAEKVEEEVPTENEEIVNIPEETTKKGLQQLSIAGLILTPEFSTDIYEYQVTLKEDKTNLDITALAITSDETVTIAGNENLKEGDNIISIIVYNSESGVDATYQITVNKDLTPTVEEKNSLNIFGDNIDINNINIKMIIIVSVLIIVAIILVVILLKNRNQVAEYDEEYIENEENDTEEVERQEKIEENTQKNEQNIEKKSIRKRKGKHF